MMCSACELSQISHAYTLVGDVSRRGQARGQRSRMRMAQRRIGSRSGVATLAMSLDLLYFWQLWKTSVQDEH